MFTLADTLQLNSAKIVLPVQGNLLKCIDKKTVRREDIEP